VSDIVETRRRLEADIQALAARLPAPAIWAKRLIGLAVGGGVGGSIFWFTVRRIRNRGKEKTRLGRKEKGRKEKGRKEKGRVEKAPEPAVVQLASPVIQVVPAEWAGQLEELFRSGRWKGPAAAIGTVWLLMRWAERRRMKRLTEALLATR
jgi:hypothetical protein